MRIGAAIKGMLIVFLALGSWIGVPGASAAVVPPPAGAVVVGAASANCPLPSFSTLNAAIAGVSAGSTIYVCAGTYPEAVTVTKNVTLLGAQWGVTATTGRTDPSQETTIVAPSGADVTYSGASTGTLSGFRLTGNGLAGGDNNGILALGSGQSGFTWTDNIITATSTGINFHVDGPAPTNITGNRITNNTEAGGGQGSNGIFFTNGPANDVTISGNSFGGQDVDLNTTGSGSPAALSQNLVVTGNMSVDSANFVVLFLTDHALIGHNTVGWTNSNDPAAGSAIFIDGGNTSPTVDANTISGGAANGIRVGASFYPPSTGVTITNNTIANRLNGVRVLSNAALDATSSIVGNTVADAGVGDGAGTTGGNGIWLQSGTGVLVGGNAASASTTNDCVDETEGTGTAGTANVWTLDTGITSSPLGLCVAPSISVVKTAAPSVARALGELVSYSFVVTNTGNGPLNAISVADTFTAPSTGSLAPQCPATTLSAGASMTCTAQHAVTRADVANGVINDSAVATGTPAVGPAVSSARSTATVAVSVPPPPTFDLAVGKTASRGHATVGRPVTYTIVATNSGPDVAPAVALVDTPSRPTKILSVRTTVGQCAVGTPLRCSLGTIAAGGRVTITVVSSPVKPGALHNSVAVTASGEDTNPNNNTAGVVVSVTRPKLVALRLHKRASARTALPGDNVTYRLTVTNPNRVAVRRVTVCDTLPAGEQLLRARPSGHTVARRYCWRIATLRAGKTRRLKLTVNIFTPKGGRLVDHATARAPGLRTSHASAVVSARAVPTGSCASVPRAGPGSDPVARAAC